MSQFVVFIASAIQGETKTEVFTSLYDFFDKYLHNNICYFIDYIDNENENATYWNRRKIHDELYAKYSNVFYEKFHYGFDPISQEKRQEYFKTLCEIEGDVTVLLKDVIQMNKKIEKELWAIKNIIMMKEYTMF